MYTVDCEPIPLKRGLRSEATYNDMSRKGDKDRSGTGQFLTRAIMGWRENTRAVTTLAKSVTPQQAVSRTRLVVSQLKADSKEGVREDFAISCGSQASLSESRCSVESSTFLRRRKLTESCWAAMQLALRLV